MSSRGCILLVGVALAAPLFSQPLISCGTSADVNFTGGFAFTDTTLSPDPQFQSMRYGSSFRYDIPLAPGLYAVSLSFIEPNKTAAGQRRFTVAIAGQQTPVLDLFALAGRQPYTLRTIALVGAGLLAIQFSGVLGNAVVSTIQVAPAKLTDVFTVPIVSDFLGSLIAVAPIVGLVNTWDTCISPPTCAGIDRVSIYALDGTPIQYYAIPYTNEPSPAQWKRKFP